MGRLQRELLVEHRFHFTNTNKVENCLTNVSTKLDSKFNKNPPGGIEDQTGVRTDISTEHLLYKIAYVFLVSSYCGNSSDLHSITPLI
jgi:hypothetical protein